MVPAIVKRKCIEAEIYPAVRATRNDCGCSGSACCRTRQGRWVPECGSSFPFVAVSGSQNADLDRLRRVAFDLTGPAEEAAPAVSGGQPSCARPQSPAACCSHTRRADRATLETVFRRNSKRGLPGRSLQLCSRAASVRMSSGAISVNTASFCSSGLSDFRKRARGLPPRPKHASPCARPGAPRGDWPQRKSGSRKPAAPASS